MSAFWESECVDGNYNDPARTKERVLEVCFFLMEPVISALHLFICLADEYVLIKRLFCSLRNPTRRAMTAATVMRMAGMRTAIDRSTLVDAAARSGRS